MKANDPEISGEHLRSYLDYSSETGVFTWKRRSSKYSRVVIGAAAGCRRLKDGYMHIRFESKLVMSHRLAWMWMTDKWPSEEIDHINGVRNDNRWLNLRSVSRRENLQNVRQDSRRRASGFLGVAQVGKKFKATIGDGRKIYLGIYETAEQAHAVYIAAKRKLHSGCTI